MVLSCECATIHEFCGCSRRRASSTTSPPMKRSLTPCFLVGDCGGTSSVSPSFPSNRRPGCKLPPVLWSARWHPTADFDHGMPGAASCTMTSAWNTRDRPMQPCAVCGSSIQTAAPYASLLAWEKDGWSFDEAEVAAAPRCPPTAACVC